jgi:hypothetical protein
MPQGRQQTPNKEKSMQTAHELYVNYMGGADNPWIPFTPLSDQVFLKYWKVAGEPQDLDRALHQLLRRNGIEPRDLSSWDA